MPRFLGGLVLTGAVVLLAGCGLGGKDSLDAAEQPKITRAQLAAMVLSRSELGTIAEGMKGEDGGAVLNAEAAEDTPDPADTGKSLRSAGRLNGHTLVVGTSSLASLKRLQGVLRVCTAVELMEDTVYAAQYLHKQLADLERFQGRQSDGSKLSGVTGFDVTVVGDEAEGYYAVSVLGKRRIYVTGVAFRRAQMVGVVQIVRGDKEDATAEARALAVKLDKRIQDVLAGQIGADPAPPEADEAQKAAFVGQEKLPALTASAGDVAPGAIAASEGRSANDDYLTFYRVFQDVRVGGSHLIKLRAETQLYRTKADATNAYLRLGRAEGRQAYAHKLVDEIARETGLQVQGVQAQPLPNAGRGFVGIVVTFDSRDGSYRFATLVTQSGKMLAAVTGFCHTYALNPGDLKPLARSARARLLA